MFACEMRAGRNDCPGGGVKTEINRTTLPAQPPEQ